jgi:transcription initiation factor IIE alpha subunit
MASNNIERFEHVVNGYHKANSRMVLSVSGEYVRYSDHERIVKELEARIRRLMTTREQAERFIRHHLHSAEWKGE